MKKKSWLEKLKLVETAGDGLQSNYSELEEGEFVAYDEYDARLAPAPFELGDDFVTVVEAYEKSGLSDLSRSIFKVDEFSKVLPGSLATETRRQSVIGILSASNLEVSTLMEDAGQRLDVLKGVLDNTAQTTKDIVLEKETEIANLLAQVDVLKQAINDRKAGQEKQHELIQEEMEKITTIVNFIATPDVAKN